MIVKAQKQSNMAFTLMVNGFALKRLRAQTTIKRNKDKQNVSFKQLWRDSNCDF